MTEPSAEALEAALRVITTLQHLDLGINPWGPAGAHLGAALRDGSALLELKLAHSNMGPDGASARTHTIENGPRSK